MGSFRTVSFIRRFGYLTATAFYEIYAKESMIIGLWECLGILFCQVLLAVGDDGHGRGEDMEEFAMGNIDNPYEAGNHMEVPEEVGIDFHVSEELGYKVTPKGNPVIGAGRCEVRQVIVCLDDFMMGNAVTLNKETGKFQEKDEGQCGHVLFFCPELIRANRKAANNGHDAAHQDKKAEEFEEEIEKRTDWTGLKDTSERKEGYAMAQFHEIPCGKPLDHIDHKGGDESKYQ